MENAPIWKRILAFIVDLFGTFIVFGMIIGYFTGSLVEGGFNLQGWPALLLFALIIAYFVVFNKYLGGTLGKRLFGIAKKKKPKE